MDGSYKKGHRHLALVRKDFLIYEEFLRLTDEYEGVARFTNPIEDGSGLDLWSHIVPWNVVARFSIRNYFYERLKANWTLNGERDSQEEVLSIARLRGLSDGALVPNTVYTGLRRHPLTVNGPLQAATRATFSQND